MMTLVTGGSKSGKSAFAESLFANYTGEKIYIATMIPFGKDVMEAIERHKKSRSGKGFITIEKYTSLDEIELPQYCSVLLECMGNLCANEMFSGAEIINPVNSIIRQIVYLKECSDNLVIVTNEVSDEGIIYEKSTELYKRYLNEINSEIAGIADNVVECVYGIPVFVKGSKI